MKFADITGVAEDERIRIIGEHAMKQRKTVGFFVEYEDGKSDRYVRKLQEMFPSIHIMVRLKDYPMEGVEMIKVGPPVN